MKILLGFALGFILHGIYVNTLVEFEVSSYVKKSDKSVLIVPPKGYEIAWNENREFYKKLMITSETLQKIDSFSVGKIVEKFYIRKK